MLCGCGWVGVHLAGSTAGAAQAAGCLAGVQGGGTTAPAAPAPTDPPARLRPPGMQNLLSGKDRSRNPRQCLRVEMERKTSMMHYQPQGARLFLKIVLALPNLVAPCRGEPAGLTGWLREGGVAARAACMQLAGGFGSWRSALLMCPITSSSLPLSPPYPLLNSHV